MAVGGAVPDVYREAVFKINEETQFPLLKYKSIMVELGKCWTHKMRDQGRTSGISFQEAHLNNKGTKASKLSDHVTQLESSIIFLLYSNG